jgi:hypothetical protein
VQTEVDEHGIISVERWSWKWMIPTLLIVGLIVLATLVLSSVFYLQNQVQNQGFDIRPLAVNPQGQVDVAIRPSVTQLVTSQPAALLVSADTHGVQVKELQLVFQVVTGTTGDLVAELLPAARLRATDFELQRVSDGFLVKFVGQPVSGNFSTNGVTDVLRLSLTPSQTGTIIFDADPENSYAWVANSSPNVDQLRPIARQTYQVIQGTTVPSPSPVIDPSRCGVGCSSNAQCSIGYRCFDGQCRLATNVTSSICAVPGDQGLQRACNEYCADSRECRGGYVCQENRCRHPQNIASTTCAVPTVQIINTIVSGCNQACSSNDQCGLNMRCFGGACRLASNPTSMTCSPGSAPTVSVIYQIPGPPKGGTSTGTPDSTSPTPSSLATGAGALTPTPSPSISPRASLQPSTVSDPAARSTTAENALEELWQTILALPQWLLLGIVGLTSLLFVFLLLSFLGGSGAASTVTRPALRRDEKLVALERRIQDLQKPPATLHVSPAPPSQTVTATFRPSMTQQLKDKGVV